MKKIIFMLFAVTVISNTGWSQKLTADKIPATVQAAFKAKFPAATKVKWEKENKMEFEADFKFNGRKVSAGFDPNGKWLQTETEILVSALPEAVQASIKNHFANFKITDASSIQSGKKGNCFESEVKKGNESFDVLFTADGKILRQTKDTEDTHDEED
ncbi:PepSY-like domain-containing protein [Flavobacterium sp. GT3R68]|uniref:PepSY-like domain-containing protein n=1 Tax=Flavobacterium sp. GT3R68 TaxID=2594437 RepID=UPI000F85D21F|nr:PepSY-like domain-containing protein [Flavobacterium sp. GT3R68]RTY88554.1 hypothetical protein EKL32_24690 [Flavobacterium sp. GSN2]TRW90587.1 hypothetical protein FNW07_11230 [Flavobacterium sp. GT3R68]